MGHEESAMSTTVLFAPRVAIAGATTPSIWSRLMAAIEANGQRRAAAALRRFAAHKFSHDPELARQLYEAAAFAERA
jgi:hypothetical protein